MYDDFEVSPEESLAPPASRSAATVHAEMIAAVVALLERVKRGEGTDRDARVLEILTTASHAAGEDEDVRR